HVITAPKVMGEASLVVADDVVANRPAVRDVAFLVVGMIPVGKAAGPPNRHAAELASGKNAQFAIRDFDDLYLIARHWLAQCGARRRLIERRYEHPIGERGTAEVVEQFDATILPEIEDIGRAGSLPHGKAAG